VLTKYGEGLTSGLTGLDGLAGLKLFGRGSTDDKGPVLGWLHTIKAYQQSGIEIVRFLKYQILGSNLLILT
jgi:acetylornithine deacetylase/succinyl-diaminopimelate desuccinylase-like protein